MRWRSPNVRGTCILLLAFPVGIVLMVSHHVDEITFEHEQLPDIRWFQLSAPYGRNQWEAAQCNGCIYATDENNSDFIFEEPREFFGLRVEQGENAAPKQHSYAPSASFTEVSGWNVADIDEHIQWQDRPISPRFSVEEAVHRVKRRGPFFDPEPVPIPTATYIAQWWEARNDPYAYNNTAGRLRYPYSLSYRGDSTFPCFDMMRGLQAFMPGKGSNDDSTGIWDLFPNEPVPWRIKLINSRLSVGTENVSMPSEEATRRNVTAKTGERDAHFSRGAMMSVWISTPWDHSGRRRMLSELKKHGITVASYGEIQLSDHSRRLGRGQAFYPVPEGLHGSREKIFWSAHHLFLYAAENTINPYYHTEKVFDGLLAGTIPVYHGDPTHIDEYVPEHSIIKTSDFDFNATKIAAYMQEVANNETLYESYLTWRNRPLAKSIQEKLRSKCATPCAVCMYLRREKAEQLLSARG